MWIIGREIFGNRRKNLDFLNTQILYERAFEFLINQKI